MATAVRERLEAVNGRFARIIHIDAVAVASGVDSDLAEFLVERCPEILAEHCGMTIPADLDVYGHDLTEWFEEEFAWKRPTGWIIDVETPERQIMGGHVGLSWGFYAMHTFYGASYDEAADRAIAWVEEIDAAGKAKAAG